MKKSSTLILLLLFSAYAYSQTTTVKGVVTDTLNKQNLQNASVSVLWAKDSVLIKFTRTDANGSFRINDVPSGNLLLMITYPKYADYFEEINTIDKPEFDAGAVKLTLKSKLLEDVMVRTRIAAIRMKGDTIEYKADSFKVSAGASVEEMLRKLPGLQVDKDGNITAHGTKVEKVLVDGEEFFGDDPTMATKNIQADAIDKVQVFDKKSDQAAFTGIDDGQKTKTLNLTLKEDKKKGYFGKLELKGGMNNRWNNVAMLNAFKGKRKLSGYGIMSSTGTTGLGWQDKEKFGEGNNMEYNADDGYFYSYSSSDEFDNGNGAFSGEGIPKSWSTGINYGNKVNKDKQNVNGSYRFNKVNSEGGGRTLTQTILPDTVFYNNESRDFLNQRLRHSMNGTLEVQLDSFTSIKATAKGFTGTQQSVASYNSQALNPLGNLVNRSNRRTFVDGTNNSFNSTFILRKRFKKPGRTISLSFDQQYRDNNSEGLLNSINEFYTKTGDIQNIDSIDQKKIIANTVAAYNTRLAYTEPLLKNTFLELSYGLRVTQSESKKLSYNKDQNRKYQALDSLFSNHFDFNIATNTGGVMLRYNGKKVNIFGGGDVGRSNFSQTDMMKDTTRKYHFINLFPRGNFQYKFNANSRFSLNYTGNTRQPTIDQIQPVRDNTNPLNIAIGNPNLKQEFRHNFSLNYNFYKVLTQSGLYTYSILNTVANAISTAEVTKTTGDSVGQRSFQFINVNGNYSMYGGGGYNFKWKKLDANVSFGFNYNRNHINTFINTRKNVTDNNSYGVNVFFYKYKEKKYNVNYSSNVSYNTSISSVRSAIKTNYYTHRHTLNLNLTLPARFEFNSNVEANFRQRISAFDQNNNVILVSGYFGRKLLKNDKAMLRVEVYDLLNQNMGFNRFINSNLIRENNYETIRRYFLLSFVWNFSKTPAGAVPGM